MCDHEGVRGPPAEGQARSLDPDLCLDSHRCVTLMGLGAE